MPYTGGFGQDVDSQLLYSTFLPFGEILDVQLPPDPAKSGCRHRQEGQDYESNEDLYDLFVTIGDSKQHRGFGFVTFSQNADALDAVDNMHLNELNGRVC